jgi:hypothetical protein
MADPYKIRIIKTGIGDPFLLGEFNFDTSDGYADPADVPVQNLNIKIEFSVDSGESFPNYGHIVLQAPLANWQMAGVTTPRYFFGLPFDPGSSYEAEQAIQLRLTFTCDNLPIVIEGHNQGQNDQIILHMTYQGNPVELPTVPVYYYWPEG